MRQNAGSMSWPELPSSGFVSGRFATEEDVEAGNAAFVLKAGNDYVGKPLTLEIPQYAIHTDPESGTKTAGILIQAESAGDQQLVGLLVLRDDSFLAGTLPEFQLLGVRKPRSAPP